MLLIRPMTTLAGRSAAFLMPCKLQLAGWIAPPIKPYKDLRRRMAASPWHT